MDRFWTSYFLNSHLVFFFFFFSQQGVSARPDPGHNISTLSAYPRVCMQFSRTDL